MKPTSTSYRLAEPEDLSVCKALWENEREIFGKPRKLGFPTVVAKRQGRFLGFLSTLPNKEAIVAGPLILSRIAHPITTMRLIEAYEVVLRLAGVTAYSFNIAKKNKRWINICERAGFKPDKKDKSNLYYVRTIQ